jgi:hypothetical protein
MRLPELSECERCCEVYVVLQERVNAGLPTAMVATTMIAVGTSHGLVLVFDATQTLRWCLGETAQEQGSEGKFWPKQKGMPIPVAVRSKE